VRPPPQSSPNSLKQKFPRLFPPVHQHPHSRACSSETTLGPRSSLLQALDELERREEGRGIRTVGCSDPKLDSLAGRSRTPLHCPALPCLASAPSAPCSTTNHEGPIQGRRTSEHHRAPPLRARYRCSNLLAPQGGSEESLPLIGVVRPLNRVSPHTARLVPKFRWIASKKIVCERGGSTRRGHCSDSCERAVILSLSLGYCVEVR
jgi:hypothetical protein